VRKGFEYADYVVAALIVAGILYAVIRRRSRPRSPASEDSEPAPDAG
jgi:hypothetical protein